ncbi:hypothetical protein [Rummeliibacillus stabekisii]|uniref:hypothetical protein n=1 Tax=Rummeliibacillus stabekisii TaxID=241244 RepID=UPI00191C09C0|nr:hypothetical protein [Rummeliibacillus stabekisii]
MNPELRALIEKQQGILNTAKSANRDLTTEEQTQFDELQREINALKSNGESNHPTPTPSPDNTQRALELERKRISELSSLCRSFDVDNKEMERFISEGTTIDQVRSLFWKNN